jgi:hypothetical protein
VAHSFYRTPNPEDVLSQGDIFFDLPIPQFSFAPLIYLQSTGSNIYHSQMSDAEARSGMQLLATLEFSPGIVITQSCDTLRVDRIMVAPSSRCRAGYGGVRSDRIAAGSTRSPRAADSAVCSSPDTWVTQMH